jgi:outer membrane beta-barrel protein
MKTRKLLTLSLIAVAGLWTTEVQAKKGPLEGEPIVRKRKEYRKYRFQLTPYVGMSLSQPFVHMGYVGAKGTFHFADWIGVRGTFGYGIVPVESKLLRAVNDGGLPEGYDPGSVDPNLPGATVPCPDAPGGGAPCRSIEHDQNPAPLRHDFRAGLVRAQWQSSLDVVFTPFAGKLGLFSAIFASYDIYLFGGLGLVGYNKQYSDRSTAEILELDTSPERGGAPNPDYCRQPGVGQNAECLLHPVNADTGVRVGGSFGGGLNLMLTDWVALNLEIQDIVVAVNLTGLNATIDEINPVVDRRDRDVFHNVTFQLGARFYLPPKIKRGK